MFGDRTVTPRRAAKAPDHLDAPDHREHPRDAGHEAVGQALLISIGLAGMLAAGRLAEASMAGLTSLMNALQ